MWTDSCPGSTGSCCYSPSSREEQETPEPPVPPGSLWVRPHAEGREPVALVPPAGCYLHLGSPLWRLCFSSMWAVRTQLLGALGETTGCRGACCRAHGRMRQVAPSTVKKTLPGFPLTPPTLSPTTPQVTVWILHCSHGKPYAVSHVSLCTFFPLPTHHAQDCLLHEALSDHSSFSNLCI